MWRKEGARVRTGVDVYAYHHEAKSDRCFTNGRCAVWTFVVILLGDAVDLSDRTFMAMHCFTDETVCMMLSEEGSFMILQRPMYAF